MKPPTFCKRTARTLLGHDTLYFWDSSSVKRDDIYVNSFPDIKMIEVINLKVFIPALPLEQGVQVMNHKP